MGLIGLVPGGSTKHHIDNRIGAGVDCITGQFDGKAKLTAKMVNLIF